MAEEDRAVNDCSCLCDDGLCEEAGDAGVQTVWDEAPVARDVGAHQPIPRDGLLLRGLHGLVPAVRRAADGAHISRHKMRAKSYYI